jgi:hypothetical protein
MYIIEVQPGVVVECMNVCMEASPVAEVINFKASVYNMLLPTEILIN